MVEKRIKTDRPRTLVSKYESFFYIMLKPTNRIDLVRIVLISDEFPEHESVRTDFSTFAGVL